jgi:streptomycin 6-kinase
VAPATLANGDHVVFKCGVPNPELTTEIAALAHFNGAGIARLIKADAKIGWLLIERLEPGVMLSTLEDDEQATQIAVAVMQKLYKPIENNSEFPGVEKWLAGLQRLYKLLSEKTCPFPPKIVDHVKRLSQELVQSMGQRVLLHGDLHHYNILSGNREPWLAIDPKGVIGEREYEIGALMKNPMPRLMAARSLKDLFLRRIDLITEITGFDRSRIIGWSFVNAVLSAWWDFEIGNSDWQSLIRCAETLRGL